MSYTLDNLREQTYTLLDEPRDSPMPQLESGSDETPTVTSDANIDAWLNEGAAVLARTCMPIHGKGTIAGWTVGDMRARLHEATVTGGGTLWSARSVRYGTAALQFCSHPLLAQRYPDWESTANGTPKYWSRLSDNEILIWPPPANSATMTIAGLILGPALVDDDTDPAAPWLADDAVRWLPRYAAQMGAKKGRKDPTLLERADVWEAEWDEERQRRWLLIDPFLRRFHYPTPPIPPIVGGK